EIGPDGAGDADRHADEEDEAPVQDGQEASQYESYQRAADEGYLVQPQGHASLERGKGVRQDGRAVREDEAAPDRLDHAEDDHFHGSGVAPAGCEEEEDRGGRE